MKYVDFYNQAVKKLTDAGKAEADLDVFILIEHVTKISRLDWFFKRNDEMPEEHRKELEPLIDRLLADEPVSYITGTRSFCGLEFLVTRDTLIPRQDTENICEEIVKCAVAEGRSEVNLLDLCTGSGCIGISLYVMLKNKGIKCVCTATDISDGALDIASKNADANGAEVTFIKSDMFENVEGSFDYIGSNPHYIPEGVKDELDKKVTQYEPHSALFAGSDGLDFYKIIAKSAKAHLNKKGKLFLEIGYDQGESVPQLLKKEGFIDIAVIKDYNGLDRIVTASV